MPSKLDHAAEVVGDAVGTVGAATAAAGKRVQQGLSEAAAAIGSSDTADRIERRLVPTRKAIANKVTRAKKTAKKRAASVTRKAGGAKKTAKKRAASVTRKAGGAKKTAKKRAASVTRKAGGAKNRRAHQR
jgi:hypothetical protein